MMSLGEHRGNISSRQSQHQSERTDEKEICGQRKVGIVGKKLGEKMPLIKREPHRGDEELFVRHTVCQSALFLQITAPQTDRDRKHTSYYTSDILLI